MSKGGWTIGLMMAIGLVTTPGTALSQPHTGEPAITEIGHVRSSHQALRTMIATATEQSLTFRRMVATIDASNVIVYIEPGDCRQGVRACLVKVTSAGPHRSLFVKVDLERTDRRLMAAIGHELRHAIEVLSEPSVTDSAAMYFFYKFKGDRSSVSSVAFETKAAVVAGEIVADEIRRFQQANDAGHR
jgi:hypothetical protein